MQIGVPIDLRITAAEAGSYKPAHGHWQRFFELTRRRPRAHVHVGASPFHDLAAAQSSACKPSGSTAWTSTAASRAPPSCHDLTALPETLERLVPVRPEPES